MGYMKNSDDNGRIGGTFDDFTTEHVVEKFEYGRRDRSENDKASEENREFEEQFYEVTDNDNDEIIREVTSEEEVREDE